MSYKHRNDVIRGRLAQRQAQQVQAAAPAGDVEPPTQVTHCARSVTLASEKELAGQTPDTN